MIMKRVGTFTLIALIISTGIFGQSYSRTDLGIKSSVGITGIEIQFYSPSIVRILKWPEGKSFSKESLSVIMTPQKTDLSVRQKGNDLIVRSKNLLVSLNLRSGKISFMTAKSGPLLSETEAGAGFTDFIDAGTRELYLPSGTDWIDFWTGERYPGGQTLKREAPVDIIPLYVRAGTILPVGPRVQYATEKRWDDLELRIYDGADGSFTLYEDENDNYNYEKGVYSTVSFLWNNAKKTLTISDRKGSFPGMLTERKFKIILVGKNKGTGTEIVKQYDKEITYEGKKIIIKL